MSRAWLLAAVIVALGLALGCSNNEECRLPSDCPAAQLCVDGFCVAQCRTARDCALGEVCEAGQCRVRNQQVSCASALGCPSGQVCRAGLCTPNSVVNPVPPTPDAGPPSEVGPPDLPDGGDDPGESGLPYGAVCRRASDCESELCVSLGDRELGRCTQTCTENIDCVFPDVCTDAEGGARVCAAVGSGAPVGAACDGGPSDCASGLCINLDGGGSVCTQECSPLPSCPDNMTCQPVAGPSGTSVPVCFPGQGLGFGETCASDSQCASALCLNTGERSVCTTTCDNLACPNGWTCVGADNGTSRFEVCAPEGEVGRLFGEPCAAASECETGLCLFNHLTGSAFCTEACFSNSDCMALGLVCIRLSTALNVCGPLL